MATSSAKASAMRRRAWPGTASQRPSATRRGVVVVQAQPGESPFAAAGGVVGGGAVRGLQRQRPELAAAQLEVGHRDVQRRQHRPARSTSWVTGSAAAAPAAVVGQAQAAQLGLQPPRAAGAAGSR